MGGGTAAMGVRAVVRVGAGDERGRKEKGGGARRGGVRGGGRQKGGGGGADSSAWRQGRGKGERGRRGRRRREEGGVRVVRRGVATAALRRLVRRWWLGGWGKREWTWNVYREGGRGRCWVRVSALEG
nr:nucleolin-like [Arachis hypogaea]